MLIIHRERFTGNSISNFVAPSCPVEVDYSHPLGRSVGALYMPGSPWHGWADVTGANPPLIPSTNGGLISTAWGAANKGNGANPTGASLASRSPAAESTTISVGYHCYYSAVRAGSNSNPIWGMCKPAGSLFIYGLSSQGGVSNAMSAIWGNGGSFASANSTLNFSVPNKNTAAISFPFGGGTGNFYLNGASGGTFTATGTPTYDSTCRLAMETNAFDASRISNTQGLLGVVWLRVLTADELQWFTIEPFAMLKPVVFRTYVGPSTPPLELTDTLTLTDSYSPVLTATATRSESLTLTDTFRLDAAGQRFDGLIRAGLVSGASAADLGFDALVRAGLVSAGNSVGLAFSGVVRETLVEVNFDFNPTPTPEAFGPIPVFPTLPVGFPVKVSIVLDTTVGTVKSLRELRFAQQEFPLWDIELQFQELRDQTQNEVPYAPLLGFDEYEVLVQLWLSMYGRAGVFAFECPWDNSRTDQIIGTGDGSTYVFNVFRTWATGLIATTAPVSLVKTVFNVKLNGSTVPSTNYFVQRNKLYFVDENGFTHPPGAGQQITMTMEYYYLCRFVEDEQDFEEFAKNRWTVPTLKFRAVIWP